MAAKLSFVPALVAGLLFPLLAAQAQDRDDSELARSLAQRGWFDLAEEICDRLEKGSGGSRATVSYIRAEIQLGKVDRETDFAKSSQGLADAVALFKKFLEESPNHPMALEAQTNIGWVQARKGRLAMDAVEVESDAGKHADLQKQAIQAYSDAGKYYMDTIEKLKKEKQTDRVLDALMDARLELPRVLIDHAKISGVDDATKKRLLTQANAFLIDFEFDYGDRPIAFEAMLEGGKCLTELGEYKQAESKLRATFALRKRLAEAKIKPNDYHNKIIYGAYIALAQALQRAGKLNEAKTFVDQILKDDKTLEKEWAGPAIKLEKAEILFKLKDASGAMALANDVINKDPNGRWGFLAKDKMKKWGEGGGVVRFSPDQMMTAADSSLDREQFHPALRDLRRCIEACVTDAEKQKFQPSAYYKMAQCYQALKRNYEAAVAYEKVFTLFPKDTNAAKSCFEAVRCYSTEFTLSADKRDDEAKEKFLTVLATNWPKDPAARNIKFVQAEKVENAGDLKGAAELYRQVGEDAEAYEAALVRQGYCYYADSSKKWEKGSKDPAVQKEVKEELRLAEEALTKMLARAADPSKTPPLPDQVKARLGLVQVANQQLAYIYMHDSVGKTKEALEFLAKVAKDIPVEDERIAKIWATQIQAYLGLKQLDEAIKVLDLLFDKYPDVPAIARACKSVAIKLDEATGDMIKAKADQGKINENLRRISRYYAKWLNLAPALNMRITMQDVLSVAETLYMIAKQINGLDENVVSFLDLKGRALTERQYFLDAAFVHALLTEGKVGKLPDRDRIVLMTRLARCYSFIASSGDDWNKAKDQYETIMKTYKVVTAQGGLDSQVLQAHRELLGVYVEEGYVYWELGKKDAKLKFQLDNASTVFSNVTRVVQTDSEPWWQAKYMVLQVLFDRGAESDVKLAKVGLENLERSNPLFDNGKHGMKDKFLELKKQINQVMGTSGK
jgi:tetratricopeptide (TPR) repeat protein